MRENETSPSDFRITKKGVVLVRQDLRERQMELAMKRTQRNRIKRRLEGSELQLPEAIEAREKFHKQLTKEQHDVVKLGKFSFMNKISEWTGTWDEKMEKEISEAAEAELQQKK